MQGDHSLHTVDTTQSTFVPPLLGINVLVTVTDEGGEPLDDKDTELAAVFDSDADTDT